jgi:hypothetical protein
MDWATGRGFRVPLCTAAFAISFSAGTAVAQGITSQPGITIYGGYGYQDGSSVTGHGVSLLPLATHQYNPHDSGFYGLGITLPSQGALQFSFYVEGAKGSTGKTDNPNTWLVTVNGTTSSGGVRVGSTSLERRRYEAGLPIFFFPASGFRPFVNPFAGKGSEEILVRLHGLANNTGDLDWRYRGIEFGFEHKADLTPQLALIGMASAGGYWVSSDGVYTTNPGPQLTDSASRGGFRGQAKLELQTKWNEIFSSSLYGHCIYWSDVPYSALPRFNPDRPAHIAFSDTAEYRVGVKLTAAIGAKP